MMKGKCNKCGKCCETIRLGISMKEIIETKNHTGDFLFGLKNFKQIKRRQALKKNIIITFV